MGPERRVTFEISSPEDLRKYDPLAGQFDHLGLACLRGPRGGGWRNAALALLVVSGNLFGCEPLPSEFPLPPTATAETGTGIPSTSASTSSSGSEVVFASTSRVEEAVVEETTSQQVNASTEVRLVDMDLSSGDIFRHTVVSGDTLWDLAFQKGLPLELIFDAYRNASGQENPNPRLLQPGMVLEFRVGNWLDKELKYGELAENIPVYDLSGVQSKAELDLVLRNQLYPSLVEKTSDSNVRKMELFIAYSIVKRFNDEGISVVGWANRHIGFLNGLLAENGLELRVALGRVIIVDDKVATEIKSDWHWWQGQGFYQLPSGIYNRWVMEADYRKGGYYNPNDDLDFGWVHEMGHYFLNLWDIYFLDFPQEEVSFIRIIDQEGNYVFLRPSSFFYPGNWLMVGAFPRPVLSPFSIEAIKHLGSLGISSWREAYKYWTEQALEEISGQFNLYFQNSEGNVVSGRIHLFVAQPDGVSPDGFTLYRHYPEDPEITITLDQRGRAKLPSEVISGYALIYSRSRIDSLALPGDKMSFGKNFLLVVETEKGELFLLPFTSYDFLLATWKGQINIERGGLNILISTFPY